MHCYDCLPTGEATPAVAVCTQCGAGVCAEHLHDGSQELHEVTGVGPYTHGTPARRITCKACHKAEHS